MSPAGQLAILCLTRGGAALGARLQALLPEAELWVPAKLPAPVGPSAPDRHTFDGPLSAVVARLFPARAGLIFICSLGTVGRLIAPHLRDKHSDPAVLVLDEAGQFTIPVLSGHVGGANALARRIAALLGAVPVITTASDVQGTIAVDLLGRELGWRIESWEHVTAASAAVVNGELVAIIQDAGQRNWWPPDRPLPPNLQIQASLDQCALAAAALVITDRTDGISQTVPRATVIYRPPSLVVGVGCNRNTRAEEIAAAVAQTLAAHALSSLSVRSWASIDAKADEPGLLEAAARQPAPLEFHPAHSLNTVDVPNPSDAPLRHVGAKGVAEPAALLSAGPGATLIVPKQKIGNCTVAVARISFDGGTHP